MTVFDSKHRSSLLVARAALLFLARAHEHGLLPTLTSALQVQASGALVRTIGRASCQAFLPSLICASRPRKPQVPPFHTFGLKAILLCIKSSFVSIPRAQGILFKHLPFGRIVLRHFTRIISFNPNVIPRHVGVGVISPFSLVRQSEARGLCMTQPKLYSH